MGTELTNHRPASLPLLREQVGHWLTGKPLEWYPRPIGEAQREPLLNLIACLTARTTKASRDEIAAILTRLANHFRNERTAAEWKMLIEDYVHDLSRFSGAHVAEAIAEYRRSKPYFPKIAELYEICERMEFIEGEELRRAKVLTGQAEPYAWEIRKKS